MKAIQTILALTLTMVAVQANAAQGPRYEEEAKQVQQQVEKKVFHLDGVTGIGLTLCNYQTREIDVERGDVYCVHVTVKDKAALRLVQRLLPANGEVDGIMVRLEVSGEFKKFPRMSGGN